MYNKFLLHTPQISPRKFVYSKRKQRVTNGIEKKKDTKVGIKVRYNQCPLSDIVLDTKTRTVLFFLESFTQAVTFRTCHEDAEYISFSIFYILTYYILGRAE